MWYLATITRGIDDLPGWRTGRHVYVNVLPAGRVRVIGAGGVRAVLTLAEAKRRLCCERRGGRPVRVRCQEGRWAKVRGQRLAA